MKLIITETYGQFGPYTDVEKTADGYLCNGAFLSSTSLGNCSVEDDTLGAQQRAQVRIARNKLLTQSDWTQVSDAPVDTAAWATYRQALRDITKQDGFPWDITWPTQP